jgi:hypothetical protein
MTENVTSWLIFGGYAFNLLAQFGDAYTTKIGLDHGLTEGGKLSSKLFAKIGITATNAIKMGAAPFILALVEAYGHVPGLNLLVGAATIPFVIHNVIVLKKAKISVKW